MPRTAAIDLDGVLRKPLDKEAQDTSAALLYASLVDNFRLVVLGGYDQAADEQFLLLNGMNRHIQVEPLRVEDGFTDTERKVERLKRLRAIGFQFEFLVMSEVDLARDLMMAGFPVLLYVHPEFSDPKAKGIQAWDELADRVDYNMLRRAERNRTES